MAKTPTRKPYISYFRVSTARQGQSGLGLDAQRQAVADFLSNGDTWECLGSFTEIESGKRSARPELTKALAACKKARATLIIAKLDRLSRNVHFITGLMESGVDFRCADMPEAGKTMLQLWAVMAEWEREMISKRTKEALAVARKRGVKLGSPHPERGGVIGGAQTKANADRFAANVFPIINEIRAAGITTLRGIAQALDARGVPTSRGGKWYAATVRSVLIRPQPQAVNDTSPTTPAPENNQEIE